MKSFANMSDNRKLAFDAARGYSEIGKSKEELNESIRNMIMEVCEGSWDIYKFQDNQFKIFALLAEIMPVATHQTLEGKFDRFCQFHDVNIGDKPVFKIEDPTVYPVLTVARGNQDVDRNRIIDTNFTIPTLKRSIKFMEEFDNFMAGRMDFARLTEKAATSFGHLVAELIADAIYGSYSELDTDLTATGSFDADTLLEIMKYVRGYTRATKLQIFGEESALANIADQFGYSDEAKDKANNWGYYGTFRGTELIALPQSFRAGQAGNFLVNDSHIIIAPADEKICKTIFEGDVYVGMTSPENRNDLQTEIVYQRMIGVGALTAPVGKYGFYKFT